MKQKGRRTHGHRQQCSDCKGAGGIRGLYSNGKNTIKKRKENIKYKNKSLTSIKKCESIKDVKNKHCRC